MFLLVVHVYKDAHFCRKEGVVAIRYMFACHNLGRMRGSVGKYTNLADNRIFIVVPKESPRGRGKALRGDPKNSKRKPSQIKLYVKMHLVIMPARSNGSRSNQSQRRLYRLFPLGVEAICS